MEAINTHQDAPIVDEIEAKIEDVMDKAADAIPAKAKSFLGGDWLGHPLHPMLTDLPIGFWTSSFLLDFLGGRRSRRTSAAFVGLGVAAAAPTVAAGLVEFQKLDYDDTRREVAVVHTASNVVGTVLYTLSFFARLRGRRYKGFLLGLLGAAAVTAGGYLGGKLAYSDSEKADGLDGHEAPADAPRDRNQLNLAV